MSLFAGALEGWRAEWESLRQQAHVRGPLWVGWQLALTALALWVIWSVVAGLGGWVLRGADWSVIAANLRLFSVGRYAAAEVWRPALVLALVCAVAGWEAGRARRQALALFLAGSLTVMVLLPIAALFIADTSPSLAEAFSAFSGGRTVQARALVALFGATLLGQQAARWAGEDRTRVRTLERGTLWTYVLLVPAALLLLRGVGGLTQVDSSDWGGLLLTLVLAAFAITLSFPLGVLLALGRRSSLPLVRWVCIGWIELIRGVPLVTVLYMASLLLPLVIPEGWNPSNVAKAIAGLTAFASAYVAEDVRGGLAAVDAGQFEAAKAVGLGTFGAYRLIILPQAIRAVIPAIAGQFISLFKDTALVLIISLRELLGIAIVAANQPDFVGRFRETLFFIAVIYFVFSSVLSRASRRLETPADQRERG